MYSILARQYSELFPPDAERCGFILEEAGLSADSGQTILDVGCATGDLAFELAEKGCRVTGIDLDDTMINLAVARLAEYTGIRTPPVFFKAGMTDIDKHFKSGSFNAVTCFGNTLPHLPSPDEVQSFFNQSYSALKPGGRFIFQIINFDKIIEHNKFNFPDIDTGTAIFRRSYKKRSDGRLDFIISLEEKSSGKFHSDSTPLLPLLRGTVMDMLKRADFSDIKIYSDYGRTPADGIEFASTYSAAVPN